MGQTRARRHGRVPLVVADLQSDDLTNARDAVVLERDDHLVAGFHLAQAVARNAPTESRRLPFQEVPRPGRPPDSYSLTQVPGLPKARVHVLHAIDLPVPDVACHGGPLEAEATTSGRNWRRCCWSRTP